MMLKHKVCQKIRTISIGIGLVLAIALLAQNMVQAAEATPQTTIKEVVVSATKTEKDLFDVASSVDIVTSEQIQQSGPATIADALRDVPGLQVHDQGLGGGAKRVTIRGENGLRVLVLIDGMKVSEQKSLDGAMMLVNPSNVERIEVIKGPASVLHGSEAIGGVVNIITKKGGKKPIQASVSGKYDGAYDSFTPFASVYGSYNGFNYRLAGDYVDTHDKKTAAGTTSDSSYRTSNGLGYLDYSWGKGKIGGGYELYRSRVGIPPASVTQGIATINVDQDMYAWDRDRYYGFLEFKDISQHFKKISLSSFISETTKDLRSNNTTTMGSNVTRTIRKTVNDQQTFGTTLQTDWLFGDHYVLAGLDYMRDGLDAKSDGTSQRNTGPVIRSPRESYEGHQQSFAAFIQDEWTITPDWTLTGGLRQTFIHSKLTDTSNTLLDEDSASGQNLSASLGLVYSGFEDWRLRAQYSQGYRYPTLQELTIGTVSGTIKIWPNPDLKPETSQNFEIGARYDANGLSFDMGAYYTLAEDYVYQERLNALETKFENADKAKTMGVEAELAYTINDTGFTPYISGAYMIREFEKKEYTTTRTGYPRATARTGVRFEKDITQSFSFHTDAFVRMAGRATTKSSTETTHDPGWTTINFAAGAKFGSEKQFFVDVNLNNILNREYHQARSSLDDPGFHVVLTTGVEF